MISHVRVKFHNEVSFDFIWLIQWVVDLYIHSPTRLHGVVPNELTTGTNLPLPYL
jgi:hypothetical protein